MALKKNPPKNAAEEIERLATKGYSTVGLSKFFNVSRRVITRWLEEDETLEDAYERGRDQNRQNLEEQIVAMTLAGKNPHGLIYLMKAKHKLYEVPATNTKLDVSVNNQPVPVLLVRDMGTDEEWAAKAAEQQRRLTQDSAPLQLEAPRTLQEAPALPISSQEASDAPEPSYAPPSWKPRG